MHLRLRSEASAHAIRRVLPLLAVLVLVAGCGGGGGGASSPGTVIVTVPGPGPGASNPPPLPTTSQLRRTTGSLATGRYGHSATLLLSGHVLVAGGVVAGTSLTDRAETFSPLTGLFTATVGRAVVARSNHTATRLKDGRVLLTGGWFEAALGILATLGRAEIFDPTTGTFSEVGPMIKPRVDHAAALLPDGRVLLTGGSQRQGDLLVDLDDAEVFDPGTGQFSPLAARMQHTHATHALLDVGYGRLLVAGGSDTDLRCEFFDVVTQTFTALPAPAADGVRFNPCAATFASGGAVIAGGSGTGSVLYARPGAQALSNAGSPLSTGRAFATATRIADNVLLVVGGVDFSNGDRIEASCDLIVEVSGATGAATYATTMRFPTGMAAHTATRLQDGRVLFCGGLAGDAQQSGFTAAYLYAP
jgi:hypothetical protein